MKNKYSNFANCLLVFFIVFFSISCSKKNDPDPDNWIVGKWYWESYEADNFFLDDCFKSNYMDFKKDYTMTMKFYQEDNNKCVETNSVSGDYELINNQKIIIESTDEIYTLNIDSHSKNKMVLVEGDLVFTLKKK